MLYFTDSTVQLLEKRAMIVKMLVVGPLASNCYIVGSSSTKQGMIIDPGADAGTILRTVQQMGLSISLIVVTHAHIDHIDALRAVKERTNAQFAIHEAERDYYLPLHLSVCWHLLVLALLNHPLSRISYSRTVTA